MRVRSSAWGLVLVGAVCLLPAAYAERQSDGSGGWYVGIPTARFVERSAPAGAGLQRMSNWCWAASIQMVLNYHGIDVTQEEVVAQTFGGLIDRPGQPADILRHLSTWRVNRSGKAYAVAANTVVFSARQLLHDLAQENPIILGISNPQGVGHAVVLTAMRFREVGPVGTEPQVLEATIRDPWPGNQSRQPVLWPAFAPRVTFVAQVAVQPLPVGVPPVLGVIVQDGPFGGLNVAQVVEGSAASRAGLRVGDHLAAADGVSLSGRADLSRALSGHADGTPMELSVIRQQQQLTVRVEFTPPRSAAAGRRPPRALADRPPPLRPRREDADEEATEEDEEDEESEAEADDEFRRNLLALAQAAVRGFRTVRGQLLERFEGDRDYASRVQLPGLGECKITVPSTGAPYVICRAYVGEDEDEAESAYDDLLAQVEAALEGTWTGTESTTARGSVQTRFRHEEDEVRIRVRRSRSSSRWRVTLWIDSPDPE